MADRVRSLLSDPATAARIAAAAGSSRTDDISVEPLSCELTNLTTEALVRARFGSLPDAPSVVAKVAHSPAYSPVWDMIPEPFRADVMHELPWRTEAEIYASPLGEFLPPGLRLPTVYAVDELGDERLVIWMEDVPTRTDPWQRADYAAAARVLGRLAGRFPDHRTPAGVSVPRRDFRRYAAGRLGEEVLPRLRSDEPWRHPALAHHVDPALRADLQSLAATLPMLLDRLDLLPRTLAHGDACPQNLLRPRNGDELVAIDWQFVGVCALGTDAAQLLAGNAEAGELEASVLPDLLDLIIDNYAAGLQDEGSDVAFADIRFGVIANLVVRSAFTALPLERLDADDVAPAFFARRAAYARFLVDLGLRLCAAHAG